MKRLLIPISIIAASFYFGSCNDLKIGDDFLEKAPGADVTLDTIFASKQYAERALAAAYRHLPYGVMYSWTLPKTNWEWICLNRQPTFASLIWDGDVVRNAIIITDNIMLRLPTPMM